MDEGVSTARWRLPSALVVACACLTVMATLAFILFHSVYSGGAHRPLYVTIAITLTLVMLATGGLLSGSKRWYYVAALSLLVVPILGLAHNIESPNPPQDITLSSPFLSSPNITGHGESAYEVLSRPAPTTWLTDSGHVWKLGAVCLVLSAFVMMLGTVVRDLIEMERHRRKEPR